MLSGRKRGIRPPVLLFVWVMALCSCHQRNALPIHTLLSVQPDDSFPRHSEGDILELLDGRWALVYTRFFGGSGDFSSAELVCLTSADQGKTWSAPRVLLANEGKLNVMSVSLLRLTSGEILLFYLRKESQSECQLYLRRSIDELQTLGEAVRVTQLPGYHVVNNDRVVQLNNGRLIAPAVYHSEFPYPGETGEFHEKGVPLVYYSDDAGRSWRKDLSPVLPVSQRSIVLQENGLVERCDGSLLMTMRTDRGRQYFSFSNDTGLTWSAPAPGNLASPLSPATIERNPISGNLLCVWNDHSGLHPYRPGRRAPLCIAVSCDEGETWQDSFVLENDLDGWFCYTSMTVIGRDLVLSYCAGDTLVGLLNRLKVIKIDLNRLDQAQHASELHKEKARRLLNEAVQRETGWIQIHAAEGLIWAGIDSSVAPLFLALDQQNPPPQLRIGVWRVLAQCQELPEIEKQHYRQQIIDAFCAAGSPDRVHAGESAGKLSLRVPDSKQLDSLAKSNDDARLKWAARWVQANSNLPKGETQLSELLDHHEAGIRQLGAYALGWLPGIRSETATKLQRACDRSQTVEEKSYHIAALTIHAKSDKERWFAELQKLAVHDNPTIRKQICHALIRKKTTAEFGLLCFLLHDRDVDVRIFAATALLCCSQN